MAKTLSVKIVSHPGNSNPKASAVQTSDGDHFAGETVDLPEDEAKLLIATGRAKEFDPDSKGK